MKKIFLATAGIFLLILSCLELKAQKFNAGYIISGGKSQVRDKEQGNYAGRYSGYGGLYLDLIIKKHVIIEIQLLLLSINGYERIHNENWTTGNSSHPPSLVGISDIKFEKHLQYVGLPIFMKLKGEKFSSKIGIQSLFLRNSTRDFYQNYVDFNNRVSTYKEINRPFDVSILDIGPKVGVGFRFLKKAFLNFEFYHGLIGVFNNNGKYRNIQSTLGLQYSLTQKKKTSEQ